MGHLIMVLKLPSGAYRKISQEPMKTLRKSLSQTKLNTRRMRSLDQMESSNPTQLKRHNFIDFLDPIWGAGAWS